MSALLAPHAVTWRLAAVAELVAETEQAVTIAFDVPDWPGHVAGQHVDIRLTAPDGYQTQRSYSISSGPEDDRLAITVERIDDGEVSPYLTGVLEVGDEIELRGPIGGHFTWRVEDGGPLLLVAGGSGIAPLMSMLRHRAAQGSHVDARMLVSARMLADLIYREELDGLASGPGLAVHRTLTRGAPEGWDGLRPARRRRDARAGRPGAVRAPARVRLRPHGLRRGRRRSARRARARPGLDPRRALRADGMSEPRDPVGMVGDDACWLDGNGVAGLLTEVFGVELTTVVRTCGSCGTAAPVGAHRAYLGPGTVLRCPGCAGVAILIARLPDRDVVQVHGSWSIELPRG